MPRKWGAKVSGYFVGRTKKRGPNNLVDMQTNNVSRLAVHRRRGHAAFEPRIPPRISPGTKIHVATEANGNAARASRMLRIKYLEEGHRPREQMGEVRKRKKTKAAKK
ncbi:MAG: hypothetical protein AABW85_01245 [archaeon]